METRRWTNPTQPQTLQIAVWLLYFRAATTLLFGLDDQFIVFPGSEPTRSGVSNLALRLLLAVGMAAAAYLIANERRTGYTLGIATSAAPLLARLLIAFGVSFSSTDIGATSPLDYDLIGLLFEVALFVLVIHPQSRDYQRIWFK